MVLKAKIYGEVHGVGFRAFVKRNADKLSITGFVANCPDGTVEVKAEGRKEILEKFISILEKGTWLSKVEKVEVEWKEAVKNFQSFEIR